MATSQAAKDILSKSPLQFEFSTEPQHEEPMLNLWTSKLPTTTGPVPQNMTEKNITGETRAADCPQQPAKSSFTIHIFPSSYDHKEHIEMSPLYSYWPNSMADSATCKGDIYLPQMSEKRTKSLPEVALSDVVPRGIPAPGMRMWTAEDTAFELTKYATVQRNRRAARRDARFVGIVRELLAPAKRTTTQSAGAAYATVGHRTKERRKRSEVAAAVPGREWTQASREDDHEQSRHAALCARIPGSYNKED